MLFYLLDGFRPKCTLRPFPTDRCLTHGPSSKHCSVGKRGPELDDLSSVAFGDPSEISHAMPHIPTNASSRLQVPPVFQQAVCLPVPTSPGGSRPPPQFLPRDVVLLQCPLCVETPSSSSPAPAALPCRDVRPCLLSCTHPATKRLAFFGSPAELNISHLFL